MAIRVPVALALKAAVKAIVTNGKSFRFCVQPLQQLGKNPSSSRQQVNAAPNYPSLGIPLTLLMALILKAVERATKK
jgi:hypothetical protein